MHNKITFGPAGYTYDEIIKMALGIVQSFASFGVTDLPDTAKHCMNLGQKLTSEYNRLCPLKPLPNYETRIERIADALPCALLTQPECVKACAEVRPFPCRAFDEERALREASKLLHGFDSLRSRGVEPSEIVELVAWVGSTIRFMDFCRENRAMISPFLPTKPKNVKSRRRKA